MMAAVRLYVPADLRRELLAAGADLNWSAIFQRAARAALAGLDVAGECPHPGLALTCSACEAAWDVAGTPPVPVMASS